MRTNLNIESYSPLKPTQVGFIFIGPNSKISQMSFTWNKLSSELSLSLGLKLGLRN